MSLFNYPKGKQKRQQTPRQFKNYGSYKRFLQHEFSRVCVYCRQPDTSAPNLNFGVDHYKPKGIKKFEDLICEYTNLYYCCGICNSRKNNSWPEDETKGPYVVNPCDYDMAHHLRFVAATGVIDTKSKDGQHTEELLQLNAKDRVKYRLNALLTLKLCEDQLTVLDVQLDKLRKDFRSGAISEEVYDEAKAEIDGERIALSSLMHAVNGKEPLPPIRATKFNTNLTNP